MAQLETRRIGGLDCRVVTTGGPPWLVLVLCHGFGAPGDDLVPVGAQLLQLYPELLDQVQIVFPAAPLSMDEFGLPGGRAWWHLDMEKLARAVETGEFRDLRRESPPQLPAAREELLNLIGRLQGETGLPMQRFLLGGFSQGSMLATDVTLHLDEKPGGLMIWSGTLLNEEDWLPRMPSLAGLPVVQSHGRQDPILPFAAAIWLREMLTQSGADVEFIEFQGPHTIPLDAIDAAGQMLARVAASTNMDDN